MNTINNIRVVVERLFTNAAGGPVNTSKKTASDYPDVIKKIEEIYDVNLQDYKFLTVDQIVNVCFSTNKARAIAKIKLYIDEYNINASDIFSDEGTSIH